MPRRPRPIRAWHLPETAPAPTGQAAALEAALEAALDRELVRRLGAVPLVLPVVEQLGLRDRVNQRVHPAGDQPADLDLGQVTQVLVFKRLLAPQPLVHVETWLAETVLPDLLGVGAEQCNDDRLARALDGLYPHLDALWQDLIVGAIQAFEVDLARLGYDITSIAFCGEYEKAELVTYGYSRDHRPDRQQLELATTPAIAGGVPLDYWVLAGNVADRTPPVANLRRLQGLLARLPRREPADGPVRPLVISDRALLTPGAPWARWRRTRRATCATWARSTRAWAMGPSGRCWPASPPPSWPRLRWPIGPSGRPMTRTGRRTRACSGSWSCRTPSRTSPRCGFGRWWSGVRARPDWMPNCGQPT